MPRGLVAAVKDKDWRVRSEAIEKVSFFKINNIIRFNAALREYFSFLKKSKKKKKKT